jgi:ABC-type polysaccharide/polyol phosphate transport system ATPase subunit
VRRALDDIPEFTGLGQFIDLPVRTYSEGMQARLSFAICTSLPADVLVLDEWLGTGDMDFQQKAQERLTQFVANTGVVVLASHSNELIQSVCTHGLWLSQGQQIISGEVALVVNAYKSSAALADRRAA